MICFMTIPKLRPLGKQVELRLFNKRVKELGYNSLEILYASLIYRFGMDKRCAIMVVRKPWEGDEPFEGLKITKGIPKKRMTMIIWDMMCLSQESLGEAFSVPYDGHRYIIFVKHAIERGDWENYEHELTGKDGVSIPAEFARGSR